MSTREIDQPATWKSLLPFLSFIFLFIGQAKAQTLLNLKNLDKEQGYTISGSIKGTDSAFATLYDPQSNPHRTDSTIVKQGKFEFKGHADTPQLLALRIKKRGYKDIFQLFFAENRQMTITADFDDPEHIVITGSATQDDYQKFSQLFKPFEDEESRLDQLGNSLAEKGNHKALNSVKQVIKSFAQKEQGVIKDYAEKHPSSYFSAAVVHRYFKDDPDVPELQSIYNEFSPAVRNCYYGKLIKDLLNTAKNTATGSLAPDFTQNYAEGKPVTLSFYRGRYVLIEFWASWCVPCRRDNPNIVQVYSKFHSQGFDILGVSMDSDKAKWKEAIDKDHLSWSQVSDLKGWNNSVRALYGFEYIPTNYLLDKGGKIIAKGLTVTELTMKLNELFK